jgi:hypothetical protein
MGYVQLKGDLLVKIKPLEYNAKMGIRAKRYFKLPIMSQITPRK